VKIKNPRLIICWVIEGNLRKSGLGKAGNAMGFTFQFSDGWWKYGQTKT
jgi:hypothetical protein